MFSQNDATKAIIKAGQRLDKLNLCPATGGNYSHRLAADKLLVTVSGCLKGELTADDVMLYDITGMPLEQKKPSAEALLHAVIYELYPDAGAALHTHSVTSVVFSKYHQDLSEYAISGYEMQKTIPNCPSHERTLRLPIFDNTQDMNLLAQQMRQRLTRQDYAFIIRGHGIYGWGKDMHEALRVIEGVEYLLQCEWELLKLKKI